MINKEEFLKTCNLTEDDLTAARISWEELTEIYEDYMSKTKLFRHLGKEFVDEYIYGKSGDPFLPLQNQESNAPSGKDHPEAERKLCKI